MSTHARPLHSVEEAQEPTREFAHTDLGLAERFIYEQRRSGYPVMLVEGIGWHWFTGVRHEHNPRAVELLLHKCVRSLHASAEELEDTDARVKLHKHALSYESSARLAATLRAAEPLAYLKPDRLDAHPMLLNFADRTVDLASGKPRAHDWADLITRVVGGPSLVNGLFDANATCPTWLRFLDETFSRRAALIAFVKRAVGYWATGSTKEQCWFLLHGGGANGKSTFVGGIEAALGQYVVRAMPDTIIGGGNTHPTGIASLAGSRMVIVTEPEPGRPFRAGLLKYLTGEQRISARRMHRDPVEFPVTFKIVVQVNQLPPVHDDSDGFWRRVRLIPFDRQVPKDDRDPDLLEKLKAERPGILRWIVEGAREWAEHGLGTAPEVEIATKDYRAGQDAVARFLDERCIRGEGKFVLAASLYAEFRTWVEANGEQSATRTDFESRLTQTEGFQKGRRGIGVGFSGLGLRTEVKE